jgi:hypothetical protein
MPFARSSGWFVGGNGTTVMKKKKLMKSGDQ